MLKYFIKNKNFDIKHVLLLALFTSIIENLSGPPVSFYWLEFLALIPVFIILTEAKNKPFYSFIFGYICNFMLLLFNVYWITNTIHTFGSINYFLSSLLFLLYVFVFSTKLALMFFLAHLLYKYSKYPMLLIVTASCFAVETLFPEVFPFHLSFPQMSNHYLIQIVDIVGIKGLSVVILTISFLLYKYLYTKNAKNILLLVLFMSTIFSYAFFRDIQWYSKKNKSTDFLKILAIQPNTPVFYSNSMQYVNNFINLTNKALKNKDVDLLIFPESATPYFINKNTSSIYGRAIYDYIHSLNIPVFYHGLKKVDHKIFSAAFLHIDNRPDQYYFKRKLFPFGEYMPLGSVFPSLKKIVPEIGNFSPGSKSISFQLPFHQKTIHIIPSICYEVTNPKIIKEGMSDGYNIIINITNDQWFGNTKASLLHLYATSMRSIENRVPLIRITNSGISTVINEQGKIVYSPTSVLSQDIIYTKIPIVYGISTIFRYLGNIPLLLFFILMFIFYRRKQKK